MRGCWQVKREEVLVKKLTSLFFLYGTFKPVKCLSLLWKIKKSINHFPTILSFRLEFNSAIVLYLFVILGFHSFHCSLNKETQIVNLRTYARSQSSLYQHKCCLSSLIRSWANYFKFNAVEISKSSFEITESHLNFKLLMGSPKGHKIAVVLWSFWHLYQRGFLQFEPKEYGRLKGVNLC